MGRRVVGWLLLLGVVVGSLATLPHRWDELRTTEQSGRLAAIDGIPSLAGVPPVATTFLAEVRRVVPARARVELVLPVPKDTGPDPAHDYCGRQAFNGRYYWYLYLLLPRPVTCGRPDVILYVGVAPADSSVPVPAGAVVHEFAAGYVIASLPRGSE